MPPAEAERGFGRWRREDSDRFRFGDRSYEPQTGTIRLHYELDEIALEERFRLPPPHRTPACGAALDAALDLLHWTAGISYWKAACPRRIEFSRRRPDCWQAGWLNRLYREGLAEFAWRNHLDPAQWPDFRASAASTAAAAAVECDLERRYLVPMGGGKDSLVALERLRALELPLTTVQVGQAPLIGEVARAAGTGHLVLERRVDPKLAELNRQGAWNGHVPITAINAAVLTVLSLVNGYDRVVFANERSADEATLEDEQGRPVNHQFSKSLAFEAMLAEWLARYVTPSLSVFSLLRRDRELSICREFASLTQYHDVFSSCNRNFHLDGARTERWCGRCPKCHFVFLAMAPFLHPDRLSAIFGANLLDEAGQVAGFRDLLALDGVKPFECVGEAGEARSALAALAADARWNRARVVRELAPLLAGLDVPEIDQLCRPGGQHHIPHELSGES